jgi:hypothetical protein
MDEDVEEKMRRDDKMDDCAGCRAIGTKTVKDCEAFERTKEAFRAFTERTKQAEDVNCPFIIKDGDYEITTRVRDDM